MPLRDAEEGVRLWQRPWSSAPLTLSCAGGACDLRAVEWKLQLSANRYCGRTHWHASEADEARLGEASGEKREAKFGDTRHE